MNYQSTKNKSSNRSRRLYCIHSIHGDRSNRSRRLYCIHSIHGDRSNRSRRLYCIHSIHGDNVIFCFSLIFNGLNAIENVSTSLYRGISELTRVSLIARGKDPLSPFYFLIKNG